MLTSHTPCHSAFNLHLTPQAPMCQADHQAVMDSFVPCVTCQAFQGAHSPYSVKCFWSGTWPVLSWMRRDACAHSKSWVVFLNLGEGMDASTCVSHIYLRDFTRNSVALPLVICRWLLHTADLLTEMAPLQALGSRHTGLDSLLVACLASSSTLLFSWIPPWPGVHLRMMATSPHLHCASARWACSLASKC